MTVSTTTNKVTYNGNGSTTVFAIPFYFLSNDDIEVILRGTDNSETSWTNGSQFNLTGAGLPAGGTLTVVTSPTDYTPASGTKLLIKRVEQYTQPTDLPVAGAFPANSVEQMADRGVFQAQQLKEILDRCIQVPETDAISGSDLHVPIDTSRGGKLLGFNAAGGLTLYEPSGSGADPVSNSIINVKDYGAEGNGTDNDTSGIQAAVNAAQAAANALVYIPTGTYKITDEILVDSAPVTIFGAGPGTVINQTTWGQPAFEIRGVDGCRIGHLKITTTATRSVIAGTVDGEPARDYAAGVYVANAENTVVHDLQVITFGVGVRFRGNTSSPTTLEDSNQVRDCYFEAVDQGILAQQQNLFRLQRIAGKSLSVIQGVGPHLIYLTDGANASEHTRVIVSDVALDSNENIDGAAMKAQNVTDLAVSNFLTRECGRGIDLNDVKIATLSNLVVSNLRKVSGDSNQAGLTILDSTQILVDNIFIRVENGEDNVWGVRIRHDSSTSSGIHINNMRFQADYSASNTANPVQIAQLDKNATFSNCFFRLTDADFAAFDIDDGDNVVIVNPTLYGFKKLLDVDSGATSGVLLGSRNLLLDGADDTTIDDSNGRFEVHIDTPQPVTVTDGDTTPSVAFVNHLVTANTGATSITDFDDGQDGQLVYIQVNDTNTTIVDGGNLKLNGNFAPVAVDAFLVLKRSGSSWIEVTRQPITDSGTYLEPGTSANVTVGYTSDVETVAYAANITPDITAEAPKIMTATGDWQLDVPANAVAGGFVMEVTNSGTVNLTLGSGVSRIGDGTYNTGTGIKNIIVGIYYPSSPRLYVAIHQPN